MVISDNLMNITLKKAKIGQNEKINILLKDSKIKDKKIEELNNKIMSLEKIIQNLIVRIENLEKNKENNSQNQIYLGKNNKIKNETNLYGSKIFNYEEEISFLFNGISQNNNNKITLKLLFSSEIDGENEEKLKTIYTKKK